MRTGATTEAKDGEGNWALLTGDSGDYDRQEAPAMDSKVELPLEGG